MGVHLIKPDNITPALRRLIEVIEEYVDRDKDSTNRPLPIEDYDRATEFIIHLDNGTRFFTGGFDLGGLALVNILPQCIGGTFADGGNGPWYETYIDQTKVTAITDLREPSDAH